ncbi:MAG TPA: DEAD/DEAH box helicase [Alphaproteobacteria bacterium]|nr:DEAD/DEAH box helicase [Alphaproteobacteria bacterium]HNS44222.1 DEAD/DEAH box helicase [Alphaproteobacteria bacterium]
MNFSELGLGDDILKAIEDIGYTTPTPIQEKAIPIVLMARDLIGLAQTGTGKTASFTLPMIEMLSSGRARSRMPRSLVLAPTRELAAQVGENFDLYGKYHKLTKALLVGGESMGDQIKILEKGVDVLIATPGRLLDLFERGQILLSDIKILVIDEADRMLDMGFIPDIERIVSLIPPTRQTLLFSATMPDEIKRLSDKFLSNPKMVSVAPPASPAKTVDHRMLEVSPRTKKSALKDLIDREEVKNAFVFCNRKKDVDMLGKWLKDQGFSASPLHGDMVQSKRTETLQAFKDGKIVLLVCSDVAARGLDVSGVSHVFNYDVPFNADDYVHRIGRTGRAGLKGKAWTLITEDDDKFVDAIIKLVGQDIPTESAQPQPQEKSSRPASKSSAKPVKSDKPRPEKRPEHKPARPEKTEKSRPRPHREAEDAGPNQFCDETMPAFLRR